MFKREDIKCGMLVKMKHKQTSFEEMHYVTQSREGILLINKNETYTMLDDIRNNLETNNMMITEVWGLSKYNYKSLQFDTSDRDCLYKRKNISFWENKPIDTKVLVRLNGEDWVKRYFAKVENDNIYIFPGGRDSFTTHSLEALVRVDMDDIKIYEEDDI